MNRKDISRRMIKLSSNWGVSLLEMLGSIAIGSVVLVGVAQQTNTYIDKTKDAYTAEHMRMYADAARGYIRENKNKFTPNVTSAVKQAALDPYLRPGFSASPNPYGQSACVVVKGGNNAYLIFSGGTGPSAKRLPFISTLAGVGGGYVKDGNAQGSGWKTTSFTAEWGYNVRGNANDCAPVNGSLVVSLDLFEPSDVLDQRYLCRESQSSNPDCNIMKQDINMGANEIGGLTAINSKGGNGLVIGGATSFTRSVKINQTLDVDGDVTMSQALTVDGDVKGKVFVPSMEAILGTGCHLMGAIAQLSTTTFGDKGLILTCQGKPNHKDGEPLKTWQAITQEATEEITRIVGCSYKNNYCRDDLSATASKHPDDKDIVALDELRKSGEVVFKQLTPDTNKNTKYYKLYGWELGIGERTFCALGFHASNQGAPDESIGPENKDLGAGGSCRVLPATGADARGASGKINWLIRAMVPRDAKIAVACHAVCIK